MSRLLRGLGLVAWLITTKHPPVDIWAQVFAAHGAACCAFDRGTVLGWNAADFPVTEALGCGANAFGKRWAALAHIYRPLQCLVHSRITHHV